MHLLQSRPLLLSNYSLGIRLACRQRNQSLIALIGDGDNSFSMRWVK
ncbi:hypothetical protein FX983_02725 [Pseudomonas frederiksbergensis]|uniref:Uncharacterized protein n=1 Tax=Pseudomonas frederiksbergensis TaxID=104087 RepID=A0A6L5C265_9PSED|nr:hypothetical protein FX983_02725 [Pseudomonas frederiksbergensis]